MSGSMRGCGNGAMAWLLGHRQTKGAEISMPGPSVTAPRFYSTGKRRPVIQLREEETRDI